MNDDIQLTTDIVNEPEMKKTPGFWFWKTSFLGLFIMAAYFSVNIGITILYLVYKMVEDQGQDILETTMDLMNDGFYISISSIISGIICGGLIFIIVFFKKGITIKDYLGFAKPTRKQVIAAILVIAGFIIVQEVVQRMLFNEVSDEWTNSIYESSVFPPLLWIALVVAAPLFEEVFFRGFMFKGYRNSKIRLVGAMVLTSAMWTSLHVQYGVYGLTNIFIIGLVLGYMRNKTGTLWIPIIMHALYNFVSTVQIALAANGVI